MTTTFLNTKIREVANKTPNTIGTAYKLFGKITGSGLSLNEQLAEEWSKLVIKR